MVAHHRHGCLDNMIAAVDMAKRVLISVLLTSHKQSAKKRSLTGQVCSTFIVFLHTIYNGCVWLTALFQHTQNGILLVKIHLYYNKL